MAKDVESSDSDEFTNFTDDTLLLFVGVSEFERFPCRKDKREFGVPNGNQDFDSAKKFSNFKSFSK